MISRQAEGEATATFLILARKDVSFLVPRRFCLAGAHLGKTGTCDDSCWLDDGTSMTYRNSPVLLFDLDACLTRLFGVEGGMGFPSVLMTRVSDLAPGTRTLFEGHCEALGIAGAGHVAFRLGSEPRLIRLPMDMPRPILNSAGSALAAKGMDGCAFPPGKGIYYFINPEALLAEGLNKAVQHAHSAC